MRHFISPAMAPSSDLLYTQVLLDKWTGACQIPPSMEFSMQEYWNSLPFPTPGDLPSQGIKPASLVSPALAGRFFTTSTTWEALRWLKGISKLTCPTLYPGFPISLPILCLSYFLPVQKMSSISIHLFRQNSGGFSHFLHAVYQQILAVLF